ncbi:MAG TPA: TonB-dependent receptor [Novosphingobium sp.]|nr:TonB-dependent receptor [Novosphingobium sp.]
MMKVSKFTTRLMLSSAAVLVMAGAAPAWASSADQSGQPAAEETGGLQDIIVTAQKREERLQSVPVAVTAVTGQALANANITDTKSLSTIVPSLNFTQSASFVQPFIRGVGSRGNTAGDEQIVPIYVDGVYQVGMTNGFFKLNSIDRIEVLRGPQGTLFGRNAVGGAINIVTRDPSSTPAVEAGIGYGRFAEFKGDIYLSGPLSNNLSANLSAMRIQDNGYMRDALRNTPEGKSSTTAVRAKLLWQPTDNMTAKLTGYYLKSADAAGVAQFPLNGNTAARRDDPTVYLGSGYLISNSFSPFADTEAYGSSVDLNYDAGAVKISSLSSIAYFTSHFATDNDATASTVAGSRTNSKFEAIDRKWTLTQELRAASNGEGAFHWLAGVFLLRDMMREPLYANTPGSAVVSRSVNKSYAIFGEAEYEFTEHFAIKAGLRYSHDHRWTNSLDVFTVPNKRVIAEGSWSDWSPRVTLTYTIDPRQKIYATYSEAYKSGMITSPIATISLGYVNQVDPEKLRSYEIGYKGDLTSNFRANIAAYYYDYKNVQVTALINSPLPPFPVISVLQNAAKQKMYGVDADFTYVPSSDLTLGLSFAWTHARYKDFTNASVNVPRPDGKGNIGTTLDVSGLKVQRTPTLTIGANATYTVPQEVFGGKLRLNANGLYNSGWYFDVFQRVGTGEYVDLNARASWTSADERYTFSIWGSNLANNHRLQAVSENTNVDRASLVRPISYGAELRVKM